MPCWAYFVLRQSRHPICDQNVQNARLRRSVGLNLQDPLWGGRPKYRRFRYGVQVISLGSTEQQRENTVYRILIEILAVKLSKESSRPSRAIASLKRSAGIAATLGSTWSICMQQIMVY